MSMLTDSEQNALLEGNGPSTEKIIAIAESKAQEMGGLILEQFWKELEPLLKRVDGHNKFIDRLKRNLFSAVKGDVSQKRV